MSEAAARLPEWFDTERFHTVVVAFPDALGRLMGKRLCSDFFAREVAAGGTHACNYLLTVDVEMTPLPGFSLANWDKGYGDFHIHVDPRSMRPMPWNPGCALVLGDIDHGNGEAVDESPRQILRRQTERLATKGYAAMAASELEFYLFRTSYRDAAARDFRDMEPSSTYLIDYHLVQPNRDEDVLARLRNEMSAAGVAVEGTKGEWGKGQHEINVVYADALEAADRHVILKHGAKEIAAQQDRSVTFMAKITAEDAGSSCHVHMSLWDAAGDVPRFAADGEPTKLFRHFLGGLLRYSRELSLFFAPTVNSYKRYQPESWAPTALVWAEDNRTTGYRVVGHGPSLRIENRMPGADVNPYLAYAATLAAGMRGIEEEIDCGPPYVGNAYADPDAPKLPATLEQAADLLRGSVFAREAFGPEVVDFYVHAAHLEADAHRREVSDWERRRYFERI